MIRITAEPIERWPTRPLGTAGNGALPGMASALANGAAPAVANSGAAELPLRAIGRLAALGEQPGGGEAMCRSAALLAELPSRATLDMGAHLADLCADLEQTFGRPGGPSLGCKARANRLPIGRAITLGLIAELLIGDAYVHGFRPGEGGRIAVSGIGLEAVFEITIDDSGRVDHGATRGRAPGLALARRLVHELGGWLETPRVVGGSRCIVTLPRHTNRLAS